MTGVHQPHRTWEPILRESRQIPALFGMFSIAGPRAQRSRISSRLGIRQWLVQRRCGSSSITPVLQFSCLIKSLPNIIYPQFYHHKTGPQPQRETPGVVGVDTFLAVLQDE